MNILAYPNGGSPPGQPGMGTGIGVDVDVMMPVGGTEKVEVK